MTKRDLGKTGMQVSEVAFGAVEIGIPYGIGVNTAEDMISETEALDLLQSSLDAGINFYDTARQYGRSEALIGKAFKARRKEVIICTKCMHFVEENDRIPSYAPLRKIMESSLQQSLDALQTDYIDVFMIHQGNLSILTNEDVCRIMSDLKKSGIVRATGVSTYEPKETIKAMEASIFDVIQLPFNLLDQRHAPLFSLLSDKGIGIVGRSVLMKGLLSDRGRNLHPALQPVEAHIKKYLPVANDSYQELPLLANRFALSFPEISSIVVGFDRKEYLHASLAIANGEFLNEETLATTKALAYSDPDFLNLHRWNKMGWLK